MIIQNLESVAAYGGRIKIPLSHHVANPIKLLNKIKVSCTALNKYTYDYMYVSQNS